MNQWEKEFEKHWDSPLEVEGEAAPGAYDVARSAYKDAWLKVSSRLEGENADLRRQLAEAQAKCAETGKILSTVLPHRHVTSCLTDKVYTSDCPACQYARDNPGAPLLDRIADRRCLITGNLCGTDTCMEGHACKCASCVRYERDADRLEKLERVRVAAAKHAGNTESDAAFYELVDALAAYDAKEKP